MSRRWLSAMVLGWALAGCAGPSVVSFQSTPPGAEVSINDVSVGRTPVALPLSCETPQQVTFALSGYHVYAQPIPTVESWNDGVLIAWLVDRCAPVVSVVLAPLAVSR